MKNKQPYLLIINLCIFAFVHLCILALPSLAQAQSATLSISPPVLEIMIAPNKKATQTFNIQAKGTGLSIIPELHLVKPSDSSGHMFVDPNPVDLSAIPLVVNSIDHPFGETIVSSDATLPITLTFEAPTTDIATDVYLALVIKTVSTDILDSSTSTTGGISALILATINPSGVMPINIEIKDFDTPVIHDSWLPLSTSPTLNNLAPIMIRPEGLYEILSPSGKNVFTLPLYPNLVLGDSTRTIRGRLGEPDAPIAMDEGGLKWTPNWRNIGPYTLRLTINTQGGTKLTQIEKTVWILPIRLSIILITIIILIISLTARKKSITVKVV